MAAVPPPSAPGGPEPPPLQYSLLLQHLVGEQRRPRAWDPAALGGIPSPPKSEEQKMVERAMESCAFKAALACVGGAAGALREPGEGWRDGAVRGSGGRGSQLWERFWGGGGEEAAAQGPPCLIFLPLSLLQCLSQVPGRVLCQSAFLAKDRRAHSLSSAQHRLSARRVIGAGVCGIKGQAVCALAVAPFTLQR